MVSPQRPTNPRQRSRAVKAGGFGVLFSQPGNIGDVQQDILSVLVRALFREVSTVVNYDHCNPGVPRSAVPLHYRNHRFDISVQVGERVLLIDVLSVDVAYWKDVKEAGHGESKK